MPEKLAGLWLQLVPNMISEFLFFLTGVCISISPFLWQHLKRRMSWYSPEYDPSARKPPHFDIITSSLTVVKPSTAPLHSRDQEVIGDANPALLAVSRPGFRFRHFTFRQYTARKYLASVAGYDENIMSFGGETANEVTQVLLDGLDCPLRFGGYCIFDKRDPNLSVRPVKNSELGQRVEVDYALIVKCPNPYKSQNTIYIFAGIHKKGTLGAALCTQPQYEQLINKAIKRKRSFAALIEVQVIYSGIVTGAPEIVRPTQIIRAYECKKKEHRLEWTLSIQ